MTLFDPEGTQWTRASMRLVPARLIALWLFLAIPVATWSVLGAVVSSWLWIGTAAVAIFGLWCSYVIVRQVQVHGWAERDDDLLVRRGRFFRRVTVVPYGRMQYVEVHQGPLARALGIARVQLHTASPGTDASLSGVPEAEASRLRDRLTDRGESQLAGL